MSAGNDLMIMSVGVLLERGLFAKLSEEAKRSGRMVYAPSGALAGIDGLRAASLAGMKKVVLITTKSRKTLADALLFQITGMAASEVTARTVLYSGSATEAVKLFPANVNVATIASLGGMDGVKTDVQVIADPRIRVNVHEFYVESKAGTMKVTLENEPNPENPKTSYLATLSAIETLRSICSGGVKVGT